MSNDTKKETTSAADTKKPKQGRAVKEDKMYVGPTIVGVVRHSTVFKDGVYPDKVKDCIEKLPMMEKLFVTMQDLPVAMKDLRTAMSALHIISAKVSERFKEV